MIEAAVLAIQKPLFRAGGLSLSFSPETNQASILACCDNSIIFLSI
jgi:hypothetical protein